MTTIREKRVGAHNWVTGKESGAELVRAIKKTVSNGKVNLNRPRFKDTKVGGGGKRGGGDGRSVEEKRGKGRWKE